MSRPRKRRVDPALEAVHKGWGIAKGHPLFRPMSGIHTTREADGWIPADGWAAIDSAGRVRIHPTRLASPDEWAWVFAHLLLHLGFGHITARRGPAPRLDAAAVAASDVAVGRLLQSLRIGQPVVPLPLVLPTTDEAVLAREWRLRGVPEEFQALGVAGAHHDISVARWPGYGDPPDWPGQFAVGLSEAAAAAVDVAGGRRSSLGAFSGRIEPWDAALNWFVSSYPLLGGLAAAMTVVADVDLMRDWKISIAAVDASVGEIYVNPLAGLSEAEWRFVMAHEMLHAGLRHGDRAGGRDPYLWNLAADFVINGWLVEMGVGVLPDGVLHDAQLAGLSAEAVYERITTDLRRTGNSRRCAAGTRRTSWASRCHAPVRRGAPPIWTTSTDAV